MLSLALAVHHLHSFGIAHLDIRTPNILLSKDGMAKLADVGLSRLVKQKAKLSMPGTFIRASPIRLEGPAGLPADIWAFGTILWEVSIVKALFRACIGLSAPKPCFCRFEGCSAIIACTFWIRMQTLLEICCVPIVQQTLRRRVVQVCTCENPPLNRPLREIKVPVEAPQEVVDLVHWCHSKNPENCPVATNLYNALEACPWPEAATAAVQGS